MAKDQPTTSEMRAELLAERKQLNRLRRKAEPDDPERNQAEEQYKERAVRYARHRIERGAGPDSSVLDPAIFRECLYQLAKPGRFAGADYAPGSSPLARETLTEMLSTPHPIEDLLSVVRDRSDPWQVFDQHAPARRLLRRWAEQTAEDPFVEECLAQIAKYADQFDRSLVNVDGRLDDIRTAYERTRGRADRTCAQRLDDGRIEIVAADDWAAVAADLPEMAEGLYTRLASVEQAGDRIGRTVGSLNQALSQFFAELIPRYFALLVRLPAEQRKKLTGGIRPTPTLAGKAVAIAASTDYTAEPEMQLGVRQVRLPARIEPLARLPAYRKVRDTVIDREAKHASTVVVRRHRSEPG